MMTSRLTPAIFDTKSSSFARPSGRSTALSKSNSASAANVTFSLVGAGGGGGGGGGGAGGGGGGGGGSQTGFGIHPLCPPHPPVQFGNGAPLIAVLAARSTLHEPVRQHRPNGSRTMTPRASITYGLSRGSTRVMSFIWAETDPVMAITADA